MCVSVAAPEKTHGAIARILSDLKLARFPAPSSPPLSLYLDHSHCPVLAPAALAALPSTRAIPDRDVFYVARVPAAPFTHCSPRSPAAAGLLIPLAPFDDARARNGPILARCCAREH